MKKLKNNFRSPINEPIFPRVVNDVFFPGVNFQAYERIYLIYRYIWITKKFTYLGWKTCL